MHFRRARADDAPRIADLHTRSWRAAYRGILPDAFLDGPLLQEKQIHWAAKLPQAQADDFILLAEDGDRLAGFIAVWCNPESKAADPYGNYPGAYVDNIHVAPDGRGRGLGRQLLLKTAEHAQSLPDLDPSLWLWVLTKNARALGFYRALGGEIAETITEPLGGATVETHRLVWTDLAALSAACRT
ncbi:GNAT family N-acetyltransferase [Elstera litoralis]|uniref:GNAT family N-acetyltransferase n=1 Tax=Elstera litoralis TaxID=552518 RepID=UPI001E62495A|nr:N-acetyltransferase [Elstera litoralis]